MINKVFNIPWTLFKIGLVVVMVTGTAYLVMCGVANFWPKGEIKIPDTEYDVFVVNTGQHYYSDEVMESGSIVTMTGYYELVKNKYRYRDIELPIDRELFGTVTVRKR